VTELHTTIPSVIYTVVVLEAQRQGLRDCTSYSGL
jgi:hypothetical protein